MLQQKVFDFLFAHILNFLSFWEGVFSFLIFEYKIVE